MEWPGPSVRARSCLFAGKYSRRELKNNRNQFGPRTFYREEAKNMCLFSLSLNKYWVTLIIMETKIYFWSSFIECFCCFVIKKTWTGCASVESSRRSVSAGECVLLNKNSNDWKQTSVVKSPCYQTALEWWEASGYFIRNMIDEKWCQLLHFNHVFVCILCTFVRVNEFSYDGIPKDGAFLTQVVHYVSVLGSGGIQFSVQRDCRCPQLESEQDSERERERGTEISAAVRGLAPGPGWKAGLCREVLLASPLPCPKSRSIRRRMSVSWVQS